MPRFVASLLCLCVVALSGVTAQDARPKPQTKPDQRQPLSPRDALGTFQLDPNFTIELVAAEPEVVDPVCFCFDAKGDLYVVEMRGYPNGGIGTGKPNLAGHIKKLQDKDGDGYYETASIFADGLRFPCGIMPWRDGFLVGDAPDLLFINSKGEKRVLYTGFGNANIQQMINGLQLHHDGWVYGCNGGNDSPVKSVEKPDAPVVQLRGMHFRFKPDVPGSIEPCSGGGQYGLAVTPEGQWLTCTNSQHLRHIVLPYHYLKRNPALAVSTTTLDIPDHGAAARVFRLAPFEAWRLERTTRRAGAPDASRYPSTELVPGGYITSACGLAICDPGIFPAPYGGNVLVCDPANNLVHRDVLVPDGSTFRAERHDKDCEFLASTDTWFRPVFLTSGPDGAMYLADFYREIIETPLSLPDDIKAKWNLNSRERGRIWRIKPKEPASEMPVKHDLPSLSVTEWRNQLGSPVRWRRETAYRKILEARPTSVEPFSYLASKNRKIPESWMPALSATYPDGSLFDPRLYLSRHGPEYVPVRIWALQLSERLASVGEATLLQLHQCVNDPHPHVRFQLALSLGSIPLPKDEKLKLAEEMIQHNKLDSWGETALLSSLAGVERDLLKSLLKQHQGTPVLLERLASLVSKQLDANDPAGITLLKQLGQHGWQEHDLAVLRGLGPRYTKQLPQLHEVLSQLLHTSSTPPTARRLAISLLGYIEWKEADPLFRELLVPQSPLDQQLQALQAMKSYSEPTVGGLLLTSWSSWSPVVRREAQELLLSRPAFIAMLLDRAEAGTFPWQQLDLARREQLTRSRNADVKKRSVALQLKQSSTSRQLVLTRYQPAMELAGNLDTGRKLFVQHCSSCHQLEGKGHTVGPDLLGALGNKTRENLFVDILDPNHEVDPRYINYVVVTKTGRTVTGLISTESASSITLKRAEGIEEVILRTDIDEMQATGKSLMPENLEESLKPQDVADVMGYLLSQRSKK